jgi:hypothetical protein
LNESLFGYNVEYYGKILREEEKHHFIPKAGDLV